MERHQHDVRMRRVVKTFIYFLIIAALVIIFVIVRRWEVTKVNDKTALVTGIEKSTSGREPSGNTIAIKV